MNFSLKPSRMSVSDLRPSLSYRLGVATRARTERHFAEMVIATDASLFAPDAVARRTPANFIRFNGRFPILGGDAVFHVPPSALMAVAGAARLYAGAALFGSADGGEPLAIIRPNERSVYVDLSGFSGSGLRMRFGFSERPGISGDATHAHGSEPHTWSGDMPEPGTVALPQSHRRSHPQNNAFQHQLSDPDYVARASAEGSVPMQQPQGFMHKGAGAANAPGAHHAPNGGMPASGPAQGGPAAATPPSMDYDDGYGTPPPAIQPQPAQAQPQAPTAQPGGNGHAVPPANGYGNGNGAMHVPPNGANPVPMPVMPGGPQQGQPMPVMPGDNAQPAPMPAGPGAPAVAVPQSYYSRPLEYVLPDFDSFWPWDIVNTISDAWTRYQNYTAGQADTSYFPFSSIVCIRGLKRKLSDNSVWVGTGTGFYIAPNLLLTNAHNFAGSSRFHPVHSATIYTGLNSQQGAGNPPVASDAIQSETISGSAATIHPLYFSNDAATSKAHDLAVVQVANAAPNGQHFRIADFSPTQDTRIAVCGYGASSHAQGNQELDWQDLLPEAMADYKQHMDADIIREVVNGGEGIHYNLQTLAGNSGSPVFIAPQQSSGNPVEDMQVIAVHSSGATNQYNHGVRLTPAKRDWALSGGTTLASGQGYYGAHAPAQHPGGHQNGQYSRPMVAPPTWAPIAASLVGTATTAGIAGLNHSSGDITWNLQKMDGWLAPGQHPTPTITVDVSTIHTKRDVIVNSPIWSGTVQGDLFAHFMLDFKYDGQGVGGIAIEPAPFDTADNMTGGLRIDTQIIPLTETFPSITGSGVQVACVEVKMMYTYEWTVENNDQVTVIYRFYGDGTYETRVRGGFDALHNADLAYFPRTRA